MLKKAIDFLDGIVVGQTYTHDPPALQQSQPSAGFDGVTVAAPDEDRLAGEVAGHIDRIKRRTGDGNGRDAVRNSVRFRYPVDADVLETAQTFNKPAEQMGFLVSDRFPGLRDGISPGEIARATLSDPTKILDCSEHAGRAFVP